MAGLPRAEARPSVEEMTVTGYLTINDWLLDVMANEDGMTVLAQQAAALQDALRSGNPELYSNAMEQRRTEVLGPAEEQQLPH